MNMTSRLLSGLAFAASIMAAGCVGVPPAPPAHPLSEERCVAELKEMIARDDLYPWTTIDRIAFYPGSTPDFVEITLNEIHRGDDGADINTHPRIDTFRRYPDGTWQVYNFADLPDFDPGLIAYDVWLEHVHRK